MNYFYEPNYLENFIECVLNVYGIDMLKAVLLIGGDGRNYSKDAIRTIIQMCPAHKVSSRKIGNKCHRCIVQLTILTSSSSHLSESDHGMG